MNTTGPNIVVTGLSAISAAGMGLEPLRQAVCSGTSALRAIPEELTGGGQHLWGKADCFKASDFMPPLKARKFDRCSLFAVAAAGMALSDAGIAPGTFDSTRIGIVLGCGFGGIANSRELLAGYLTKGIDGLVPMLFPNTVPNAPASNASIEHGLKGPNVTFVQRFCSAEAAVHMACRFLEEGRADIMLTGGVDELDPAMVHAFQQTGQLLRYGRSFGEGAGLLVLERAEHAQARGATVRATLDQIQTIGRLIPGREKDGIERLLSRITPPRYISLSGTAAETPLLCQGLPQVPRLQTGELLGRSLAMGGLAMVALVMTMPHPAPALHLAASPEGPYYAIQFSG